MAIWTAVSALVGGTAPVAPSQAAQDQARLIQARAFDIISRENRYRDPDLEPGNVGMVRHDRTVPSAAMPWGVGETGRARSRFSYAVPPCPFLCACVCRVRQALRRDVPVLAKVTREYRQPMDDWAAVDLTAGDIVHIVDQRRGDGWWYGIVNGRLSGRFPASHVRVLDSDEVRLGRQTPVGAVPMARPSTHSNGWGGAAFPSRLTRACCGRR